MKIEKVEYETVCHGCGNEKEPIFLIRNDEDVILLWLCFACLDSLYSEFGQGNY